jgi:tetratricopeptide (TPR) repeat protein
MSYSAARLTCFALISALEQDLRSEIETSLGEEELTEILSADEIEKAIDRRPRGVQIPDNPHLSTLIPYLDFGDSIKILNRNKSKLPKELQEALRRINPRLDRTTQIRNRVAHSRPMEIDDLSNILEVTSELQSMSANYWHHTTETVNRLKIDPSYVLGLTITLPTDRPRGPMHNLPVADFDETGFFGRREQLAQIKRRLNNYPVVSVIGDGGIGKTSVALKIAYELLDDGKQNFDAIVWVTAKTTTITGHEFRRINDAIEDSLGLFNSAAEVLGPGATGDPVREIQEYLENFRVLLILDNLETVLDNRLREFLLDVPAGSKVLLTSRISAGVENTVHLGPLNPEDSERLLRTLARIRDISVLKTADSAAMAVYSEKMQGRPAYIKWFVSGVQSGRRPEEILSADGEFLDFCMSNVYEYLNDESKSVLRCMQVLPGSRSQGEISFLINKNAGVTQETLLDLIRTNFIQMNSQYDVQAAVDTSYDITEFAKSYLDRRHPPSSLQRREVLQRNKELHHLGRTLKVENSRSPYDANTVDVRDSRDYSTARLLREAISDATLEKYEAALATCREAQLLSPTFSEAWRVEAHIQELCANYPAARIAYERAHELASDSPTLCYFYGKFLVDEGTDLAKGLEFLRRAASLDASQAAIYQQMCWLLYTMNQYDEALAAATHTFSLKPNYEQGSFCLIIGLRSAQRRILELDEESDLESALEIAERAIQLTELSWVDLVVGEALDRMTLIASELTDIQSMIDDDWLRRKAEEYRARLLERVRQVDPEHLGRKVGKIRNIPPGNVFGFIESEMKVYFFHLRNLDSETDWPYMQPGALVSFSPYQDPGREPGHGWRAAAVRWID